MAWVGAVVMGRGGLVWFGVGLVSGVGSWWPGLVWVVQAGSGEVRYNKSELTWLPGTLTHRLTPQTW